MSSSYQNNRTSKSFRSKIFNYFSVRINGESNHKPSRPQSSRQQFQQPTTYYQRTHHSHARAGHHSTKEHPTSSKREAPSAWDMPQASTLPDKPAAVKLGFWDGFVADINAALNGAPPPVRSSRRSNTQPTSARPSSNLHHRHHPQRSESARSSSRPHHPENSTPQDGRHERSDSGYRSVSSQTRRGHDERREYPRSSDLRPTSFDPIPEIPAPVHSKDPKKSTHKDLRSSSAEVSGSSRPASRSKRPADADQDIRHPPCEPTDVLKMPFTKRTEPLYTVPKHDVHINEASAASRSSVRASIETQRTCWEDFVNPPSDSPIPKIPSISTAKSAADPAPNHTPSTKKPSVSSGTHGQQPHQGKSVPSPRKAVPVLTPLITRKPVPTLQRIPKAEERRDPSRCELCKGPSDARTSWPDIDRHLCVTCARKAFHPEPANPPREPSPPPGPEAESDSESDAESTSSEPSSPTSLIFKSLFQPTTPPSPPAQSQYFSRPPSPSRYAPPSPSSLDPDYFLPSPPTSPLAPRLAGSNPVSSFSSSSYTDRYASTMNLNPFGAWPRPARAAVVGHEESSEGTRRASSMRGSRVAERRGRDLTGKRGPRSPSPLIPVTRPPPLGQWEGKGKGREVEEEGKGNEEEKKEGINRRSSFYGFYDEVLKVREEWNGYGWDEDGS